MANMCDWILKAKCKELDEAVALVNTLNAMKGQLCTPTIEVEDNCYFDEGVDIEANGECAWNLTASGMRETLCRAASGTMVIEVFADYSTEFDEEGNVISDTQQEHLKAQDKKIVLHEAMQHFANYGEFDI